MWRWSSWHWLLTKVNLNDQRAKVELTYSFGRINMYSEGKKWTTQVAAAPQLYCWAAKTIFFLLHWSFPKCWWFSFCGASCFQEAGFLSHLLLFKLCYLWGQSLFISKAANSILWWLPIAINCHPNDHLGWVIFILAISVDPSQKCWWVELLLLVMAMAAFWVGSFLQVSVSHEGKKAIIIFAEPYRKSFYKWPGSSRRNSLTIMLFSLQHQMLG